MFSWGGYPGPLYKHLPPCPPQELVGVSEANRRALEVVDSALLVVCLDDAEPHNEVDVTHRMLHNYGANRLVIDIPP